MNEDIFKNQEKLNVKIRMAKPEDWKELRDFRLEIINNDGKKMGVQDDEIPEIKNRTDQDWKNIFLEKENQFTVVLVSTDSKIIGIGRADRWEKAWYLGYLFVRKEFRGIGLSSKITAARLNEIRSRGGKEVWTFIKEGNTESLRNARSFGFEKDNTFLPEESQGLDKDICKMILINVNDPKVVKKIDEVLNER
ncbi:GNAT family N-acetyltransferase [Patescibacteria group bacterium]|nr:GNAT family N-acetyltransferase [Patescibacteria group bacterium]